MILAREITQLSFESFRERSKGKKLVLLYPWTSYRNVFLNHYLSLKGRDILYYRVSAEQNTLNAWLEGMMLEFRAVTEDFGKNLDKVLETVDARKLALALVADLKAHSAKTPLILFLDEFDRVAADDALITFFRELLGNLPAHIQIALSSRMLTHQPWYDYVQRGEAIVLGTERRKDDVIFRVEEQVKPQLEVYALGRGHVLVNGQPVTNWDGALPRNLFFFFMDNPLVTRDEIFATFWPDLPVKDATNVFHVTKRKISERISMKIGDSASYELTQYGSGFYTPSEKLVRHYDVSDFETAVERALLTMDEREEVMLLTRAIDLYKGPFLQGLEMSWMVERREKLRALYGQALISVGRIALRRGEQEKALGLFLRALKETPGREDVHRSVMSLYLNIGMVEDARAHYLNLVAYLREHLGIEPSAETRNLYALVEQRL